MLQNAKPKKRQTQRSGIHWRARYGSCGSDFDLLIAKGLREVSVHCESFDQRDVLRHIASAPPASRASIHATLIRIATHSNTTAALQRIAYSISSNQLQKRNVGPNSTTNSATEFEFISSEVLIFYQNATYIFFRSVLRKT